MKKVHSALFLIGALAFTAFMFFRAAPDMWSEDLKLPEQQHIIAPVQLEIIAQVGPWPTISRLIGYRGRLWFANSVKGRNHNSADIWSLDPATGTARYERNLFSQDAGHPLVYKDLLYWPLEDALLSFGNGIVDVTNGETWQSLTIANQPIYHTSQLLAHPDGLFAVTGTRNAGLQLSQDAGRSWEEFYIHPTPTTHVSRLKELTIFKGEIYASLKDAKIKRLTRWTGNDFQTVRSWPLNRYFNGLNVHQGAIYGLVGQGREREIWKFDGQKSLRVGFKGPFTDLASDGKNLWLVTRDGHLWSSPKGEQWRRHGDLAKGKPVSIHSISGYIYVAGTGDDGRGIIWGRAGAKIPSGPQNPAIVLQVGAKSRNRDWDNIGQELDRLLADRASYQNFANNSLWNRIDQIARDRPPSGFFAKRLAVNFPDQKISAFGGSMELTTKDLAYAYLLWGMKQSGLGEVPVAFLKDRWQSKPNSYEKYFELELNAIRTIQTTGQNDTQTVKALVDRLSYPDDPIWFRSQVIGTLTAVSGQKFGYDIAAWQNWASEKD
ncbi:MAG: hypothetical protein ABJO01_00235 [Parasphingorhabdus sp.]|uniref:hypothetical protein n=1 Tax=Parasphingorhabdus sp. TaxID=2709688 RepID=UPI003297CB00